jgi:hypothetical protein
MDKSNGTAFEDIHFGRTGEHFNPEDAGRCPVDGKFPSVPHGDPDDTCGRAGVRRAGVRACGRAGVRCGRAATPSGRVGDVAKP